MRDYDVVVIGCGPAGQKAAIKCAKAGLRVAIIDDRQVVGGQCLHVGTIPSKTLREAIIYLSGYHQREIYGDQYRLKADLTIDDLLSRVRAIIEREIDVIHNQLTRNGVNVISGEARFVDPYTVSVTESVGCMNISASNLLIATGTVSHNMDNLPMDGLHIMNSDDILRMPILPRKLMIVGAGVIGCEYASMFSLLDMEVTLVSQYSSLMPFVDRQLVDQLIKHMEKQGVNIFFNDSIESVKVDDKRCVNGTLKSGTGFDVDLIMYCGARWGNTRGMNLEAVGVNTSEKDLITVDEHYRTSVPHVYAAGDVIGFPQLASASIDQGRKAANQLLGQPDVPYKPIFPFGIYTYPEISMVGESEEMLKERGQDYLVGIGRYSDTARGQIVGDSFGICKLIFDPATRKLLGVHIIGREATELIHVGQSVMIFGGVLDYFVDTVFNYPTLAEVYKIASLNGLNQIQSPLMPLDVFGNTPTAVHGPQLDPDASNPETQPDKTADAGGESESTNGAGPENSQPGSEADTAASVQEDKVPVGAVPGKSA